MHSQTGSKAPQGATADTSALEAEVRSAIVHGDNVQQTVRDLTVRRA